MATTLGKNAVVIINGATITTWCTQIDLTRLCNLLDGHTFGDSAVEKVPGLSDASVSLSGYYTDENAATAGIDLILNSLYTASIPGGTGFTINIYPVGTASGKAYYTNLGFLANETMGPTVAGLQTWKADLQFSGGASRSTVA